MSYPLVLFRKAPKSTIGVSVKSGVNLIWHLSFTTVFQQLTALSWGRLFRSPPASRSATAFPHSAIGSSTNSISQSR